MMSPGACASPVPSLSLLRFQAGSLQVATRWPDGPSSSRLPSVTQLDEAKEGSLPLSPPRPYRSLRMTQKPQLGSQAHCWAEMGTAPWPIA